MIPVPRQAMPVFSERFNFAFSENGRHGVCMLRRDGEISLERWALDTEDPSCEAAAGVSVDRETCPLPLDDGRVLLLHRGGPSTCGRHELVLVESDGTSQHLGEVAALPGGYLLPSPTPTQLGYVVALDDPEHSTVWRVRTAPYGVEPVMRVPGSLLGGVWLDGDVLAINQTAGGARASGIAVDVRQGSWRRIWSLSDRSTDRIVHYSPRSQRLVVATNASGEERLGWARLGGGTAHFPEKLHRAGYPRRALAMDESGERLLVHEAAGAVSRLFTYGLTDDRRTALACPPSTVSAPASWVGDLVRYQVSAPCQPPTLATVRVGTRRRASSSRYAGQDRQAGWARADLVELDGAQGPIEAIVYGGSRWRYSRHLVVALHGGPLSSWRFAFDPLFQSLAAAGVAVVAPNYRGSTGYGDEHLRAVIDDWGGPDLDDVLHIGRGLAAERRSLGLPGPVVLGASYGAFLALLAACHEPALWSACVALAPFLSAQSLHANGGGAVRDRTERLGGLRPLDDATRPRDVLRACTSLSVPLLLGHGAMDATVPVEQSRTLRRRLLEIGKVENLHFEYVETGDGHTEMARAENTALRRKIVSFCVESNIAIPDSESLATVAGNENCQPIPVRGSLTVGRR